MGGVEGTTRQMEERRALLGSESSGGGVSFVGGGRRWSSVSAAVLDAPLVLKVVVTVLTNSHR